MGLMGNWTKEDLAKLAVDNPEVGIDEKQFIQFEKAKPSTRKSTVEKLFDEYRENPEDRKESLVQGAVVKWYRYWREFYPALKHVFAVPNGGKRSDGTGRAMKREGTEPGVSDLICLYPAHGYGALLVEMKREGGYVKPKQREWLNLMVEFGNCKVVACWSADAAKQVFVEYLELPESCMTYP